MPKALFTLVSQQRLATDSQGLSILIPEIDVKPNNVLVNYADESQRQITEVQLADFGSTVSERSGHAKDGDDIGSPIFRSPEAQMQLPWTTATDIWSFGVTVGPFGLIYVKDFVD